jgi:hypothetical protein
MTNPTFDWRTHPWEQGVGEGWQPLCLALKAACLAEDVEILQVKEKFGGLRWYTAGIPYGGRWQVWKWRAYWWVQQRLSWTLAHWLPRPKEPWLRLLIDACEGASYHLCEACGQAGTLRGGGWWLTRCDACQAKRA